MARHRFEPSLPVMNGYLQETLARERQRDLLREAELERLAGDASPRRTTSTWRVTWQAMVRLATALRARPPKTGTKARSFPDGRAAVRP
jgi:hypothetical protein